LHHLFIAGVPTTGKTCFGDWLAREKSYIHVNAELPGGTDFDLAKIHTEWDAVVQTGRAEAFIARLNELGRPVVITWGFRLCYLYIIAALKEAGIHTWWFHADYAVAREAFVARGGIDVQNFEIQMADIQREWALLKSVFHPRVVETLSSAGRLTFEQIWVRVGAAV
jgi:hypothetical protein